jgi:transposase
MFVVGVDVSKDTVDVCFVPPGKEKLHRKFANTAEGLQRLFDWLIAKGSGEVPHCVMEATGVYHQLPAFMLHALGSRVSVVNPLFAHNFVKAKKGRHTKTDKADAYELYDYGMRFDLREWFAPSWAMWELRDVMARLSTVTGLHASEQVRLTEHPRVLAFVSVGRSILRVMAALEAERKALLAEIEAYYVAHPEIAADRALLVTIPGVGKQTADHLLVHLRERNITSARQAAALSGLIPIMKESGTSVRGRPQISRQGSSRIRAALFMPAFSAIRHCKLFREQSEALQARGKSPKSAAIAVMHKMIRVAFGVLRHRTPFALDYAGVRAEAA